MHNFKCVVTEDASYMYKDKANRMLDMSSANIDLDERIDFTTCIKPLLDEKKIEYVEKIKSLQTEFNQLENSMC